ncbi:hypothetical protein QAD02_010800 [Eretmocerus hayati]|uniref:Uncharacterized protein n=1 Tax=Eretmocerus hayati TaxID=131215 RepID=A0ACC2NV86_9HYME|nr:hypothetical protein QAD02_010800 [Eretmocerus hayati]
MLYLLERILLALAFAVIIHGSRNVQGKRIPVGTGSQNATIITQGVENFTTWRVECINATEHKLPHYVECNLIVQEDLSPTSFGKPKNCNFFLHPTLSNSLVAIEYIRAYKQGDTYIISWIDYDLGNTFRVLHAGDTLTYVGMFLNFVIIPMPNCDDITPAKTRGAEFESGQMDHHFLMENHKIYLNEDSFDVFYIFTKESQWAQERFKISNRTVFSSIFGPVLRDFQANNDAVMVVNYPNTPNKLIQNRERYKIREICLQDVFCDMPNSNVGQHSWSTANGAVSYCNKNSSNAWQCYKKLNTTTMRTFNLSFNYEVLNLIIYNLPYELILAVTTKKTMYGDFSILVTAFAEDEVPYESVIFYEFEDFPSNLSAHVFDDEKDRVCLTIVWTDSNRSVRRMKCYTRNEITVKAQHTLVTSP